MRRGHQGDLFLLAADHRDSLRTALAARGLPADGEALRNAKQLIWEGFLAARDRLDHRGLGILVDEETGAGVARSARAAGVPLAMPVESSGVDDFCFAYGDDFGRHIEDFDPDLAKVLVRWNPADEPARKARQAEGLARLAAWLGQRARPLLFELIVPPSPGQLAAAGGDRAEYDHRVRPALMVESVAEIHAAGIEPVWWKLEGIAAPAACRAVADAVRAGGRSEARAVVLGRGEAGARVDEWLRAAARTPGYAGFAVGRTIWWEALAGWQQGIQGRAQAVEAIALAYSHFVETYRDAASAARP